MGCFIPDIPTVGCLLQGAHCGVLTRALTAGILTAGVPTVEGLLQECFCRVFTRVFSAGLLTARCYCEVLTVGVLTAGCLLQGAYCRGAYSRGACCRVLTIGHLQPKYGVEKEVQEPDVE